jgi:hypothetical protein
MLSLPPAPAIDTLPPPLAEPALDTLPPLPAATLPPLVNEPAAPSGGAMMPASLGELQPRIDNDAMHTKHDASHE